MNEATSSREASAIDAVPLVVGVGSLLRGDDAIGWRVAEAVERKTLAGVTVRTVTQLVPELTDDICVASVVVFVDADVQADRPTVRGVDASEDGALTHHATPESLCRLCDVVGMARPPAYLIGMPAREFELGAEPTAFCLSHVDRAVGAIGEIARSEFEFPLPGTARAL